MIKGYKAVRRRPGRVFQTAPDSTVNDFVETMAYGKVRYADREDFLSRNSERWMLEFRDVLKQVLRKDRTVLGIGSGECEHEIPLFLEGYPITGSDIAGAAFEQTKILFPEFPVIPFDIFHPDMTQSYDDLLITGLDSYFPQDLAAAIFIQAKRLLHKPDGRLLFALRYRDNWATRLIDWIGTPLEWAFWNLREIAQRSPDRFQLKHHGYRRNTAEIIVMARQAGFHLKQILHAGFGYELNRVAMEHYLPWMFSIVRWADRRWHVFNNVVLFEFVSGQTSAIEANYVNPAGDVKEAARR